MSKVLFWVLALAGFYVVNHKEETERQSLEAENIAIKDQIKVQQEAQKEQIDFMIEESARRDAFIKTLMTEKSEAEKQHFIISHFPFPGEPWTIEKYWIQEELWIALQSYSSRTAAEDVKAQLESGKLKTRDLFR